MWFYLSKALAPIDLVFVYPQWEISTSHVRWWLPLVAAIIVSAMLWKRRTSPQKRWVRAIGFAWMFFCVALLPVLGFVDVGFMRFSLVADHYQHLAIIAVTALAAAGWSVWHFKTRGLPRCLANGAAIATLGVLVVLSWQQSAVVRGRRNAVSRHASKKS